MSDISTSPIVEQEPEFPYPGDQGPTLAEQAQEGVESAPEADQIEADPSEQPSEEDQAAQEQEELETVTITKNGREYVIPKDIEEDILFHSAFTKKSQEHAENVRAFEAQQEANAARMKVQQEHLEDVAKLHAYDQEIQRLNAIAAGQIQVQSQEEYQQAVNALMLYRGQRDDLARQVEQRVADAQREAQEGANKRRAEAREYAAREIPNWTPETENSVRSFAVQQGIPERLIDQAIQAAPATQKILHLANIGQQFLDSQRKATKPQKKPVQIKKVGGGGSAPSSGPSDDMSPEEWRAARYRQLAARRGKAR